MQKRTKSRGTENLFDDEKKYSKVLLILMIAATIIFGDAPTMYVDGGTLRLSSRGVVDAILLNNITNSGNKMKGKRIDFIISSTVVSETIHRYF